MLQNRVDPLGKIIKTEARGTWMGNRGSLHNKNKEILRPFKVNAWLTCRLEFKGRKREIMAPGKYTELFFLDEATAFSAGHRPCSECRREDHLKFKQFWIKANPEYGFSEKTLIGKIDEILHSERVNPNKSGQMFEEYSSNIPNGTFVLIKNKPYLVFNGLVYLWSPFGYTECVSMPLDSKSKVITPQSIVRTFKVGYIPQIDLSAKKIKCTQ